MAKIELFDNQFTVQDIHQQETLDALADEGARRIDGEFQEWIRDTIPILDRNGKQKKDAQGNLRWMSKQRCAKFALQHWLWELVDKKRRLEIVKAVGQFDPIDRFDDED